MPDRPPRIELTDRPRTDLTIQPAPTAVAQIVSGIGALGPRLVAVRPRSEWDAPRLMLEA